MVSGSCDNMVWTSSAIWLHLLFLWVSDSPLVILGWHWDRSLSLWEVVWSAHTHLSHLKFPAKWASLLGTRSHCLPGWRRLRLLRTENFVSSFSISPATCTQKLDFIDFILQSNQCKYYQRNDTEKLAGFPRDPYGTEILAENSAREREAHCRGERLLPTCPVLFAGQRWCCGAHRRYFAKM